MADMIENNEMAFAGSTPWHDKGTQVNPNSTPTEWLKAAKLDWTVQRRLLAMRDALGTKDVLLTNELSEYRAIVRSDNNTVFQVSRDRYQCVQNSEIIDVFAQYCEAGHATMETVGAIKGGCIVWALAKLNSGTTVKIGGIDEVRGYMLFATSHDGTVKTIGKATQVRVVCNNTLQAAMAGGKAAFALKHSAKFDATMKERAREQMGIAITALHKTNEQAELLSRVSVNDSDWLDFMARLLGSKDAVVDPQTHSLTRLAADIKSATLSSPGASLATARGTLWGVVNGVSYFTDHQRGRSQDSRLASAWFGVSSDLKQSAMEVALEMAAV